MGGLSVPLSEQVLPWNRWACAWYEMVQQYSRDAMNIATGSEQDGGGRELGYSDSRWRHTTTMGTKGM
jgi:hypothetical protein